VPHGRTIAERIERRGLKSEPLADLYHFLIVTSWPRLLGTFAVFYVLLNALFALGYWLDPGGVENELTYLDAFFFSVQTMATIGYGRMAPTSVLSNVLVTIEALLGMLGISMSTGLMFAKFSRPRARVMFSQNALVSVREGKRSLLVRLANARRTGLVEASLHLVLTRDETTAEGERMRRFHPLPLVRSETVSFNLSWTAVHVIDESSPLFGLTAESLAQSNSEIVASLVGLDEVTRDTAHVRHVWTHHEVLFDKRFVDMLEILPDRRVIDFGKFHQVEDQK
jgi:inward rectifier potassium channel